MQFKTKEPNNKILIKLAATYEGANHYAIKWEKHGTLDTTESESERGTRKRGRPVSLESPSDSDSSSVEQEGLNLNFSTPKGPADVTNPGI